MNCCRKCGKEFEGYFCPKCGTRYEEKDSVEVTIMEGEPQGENTSYDMSREASYEGKNKLFGILSLIFGIISICSCGMFVIPNILGIVFGVLAKKSGNKTKCSVVGLVCSVIATVFFCIFMIIPLGTDTTTQNKTSGTVTQDTLSDSNMQEEVSENKEMVMTESSSEEKEKKDTEKDDSLAEESQEESTRLDYTISTIDESCKKYLLIDNPYYTETHNEYVDMLNKLCNSEDFPDNGQKVENCTLESVLKEAGLSSDFVSLLMENDGINIYEENDFKVLEEKSELGAWNTLMGKQQANVYYEVVSDKVGASAKIIYFGETKKNKPDGEGIVLIKNDNGEYRVSGAGHFKDGKINGEAVSFSNYTYGDVLVYSGECVDNFMDGEGVDYRCSIVSDVYETWMELFTVQGTQYLDTYGEKNYSSEMDRILKKNPAIRLGYICTNSKVNTDILCLDYPVIKPIVKYKGEYSDNQATGKGVYYYLLGRKYYEGEISGGKPHGEGTLYYDDGQTIRYKGEFRNGAIKGNGVLYDENGTIIESGEMENESVELEFVLYVENTLETFLNEQMEEMDLFGTNDSVGSTNTDSKTIAQTDSGYILPESNIRYYTYDELSSYDDATLRIARNEIYARYGRIFTSEDLKSYFESQPWYVGIYSAEEFREEWLNEYELRNLELINEVENSQEVQTQTSYQNSDVSLYEAVILDYENAYGDWSEYILWDINEDGIKELIVSYGTCNADWTNSVYTLLDNEAVWLGDFYGAVYVYDGDCCIYSVYEHMDYMQTECISIYENELFQEYMEGTVHVGDQLVFTYTSDLSALY